MNERARTGAAGTRSAGSRRGFYVAPFGPDGQLIDVGFWAAEALSPTWLDVCGAFLANMADSEVHSWEDQLDHIAARVTSRRGAALVTFYVDQATVLSAALLSGLDPEAESDVAGLFVESLRKATIVRAVVGEAAADRAFDDVRTLRQRPLAVFVVWHPDGVSDENMELVRELSLHLAWAYFRSEGESTAH